MGRKPRKTKSHQLNIQERFIIVEALSPLSLVMLYACTELMKGTRQKAMTATGHALNQIVRIGATAILEGVHVTRGMPAVNAALELARARVNKEYPDRVKPRIVKKVQKIKIKPARRPRRSK